MAGLISSADLQQLLASPAARDRAFLDVRDGVEYNDGHIAGTTLLPRGQVEGKLRLVVPDLATPVTLVDADGRRAVLAAATAEAMGYRHVQALAGGLAAWAAAGLPVEWGSNVISKDFGEKVQVQQRVAEVTPEELHAWQQRGENIILLDSRTPEEHTQACIPGSRSVPGGELPLRITDLRATNPEATVVVHCAGRTRSIIGARVLQRMGIPKVYALKNGTMGWHLAGLELETGSLRLDLPAPTPEARANAEAFAVRVAQEDGARFVDAAWLAQRRTQGGNLYLLDVRTQAEYEAGHLPGFQWVPGGQAVQRAEDAIGVPNGDIVFACDGRARAAVAASWYRQMGYPNVYVLAGGITTSPERETGPQRDPVFGLEAATAEAAAIAPAELAAALAGRTPPAVLHVGSSREYERRHVPASLWLPRAHLELLAAEHLPDLATSVVLTCNDGVQATLAAAALAGLGYRNVRVLPGGLAAWAAAGQSVATGPERLALEPQDFVRAGTERDVAAMIHYLEWEEELGRKYETGAEA